MLIGVEEVILPVDGEAFPGQLGTVLAVAADLKLGTCLSPLSGIRVEGQDELPIGKLAYLPCPLQCRDTIHDDVLAVPVHDDAKIVKNYRPAKDRLHPGAVIFPRISRVAPLFPFPAVRARLGDAFFGIFPRAGLFGLIISIFLFSPFHFT